MKNRIKQAHNHDQNQTTIFGQEQTRAVARRNDPETSHEAAASVQNIRASHRRVMQLFRTYGPMTDEQAYEAAVSDGWKISRSGLRTRRSELCFPRGGGIMDSGRTFKTESGRQAVIWELDPSYPTPERFKFPSDDADDDKHWNPRT